MKDLEKSKWTEEETRRELKKWEAGFIESEKARLQNAALLVKIIDQGGWTKDEIATELKFPVAVINKLEQIGRRTMHPSLLLRTEWQYSCIGRMPLDEQKRLLDNGVDLLTTDKTTLRCDVDELQPTQARQIFDYSRVRSVSEQAKWIEEQKQVQSIRDAQTKFSVGYQVMGNTLVVKGPMTFSRVELKKILQEM